MVKVEGSVEWGSPEGKALYAARQRQRPPLSIRQAAIAAGLSEARWRQIEAGYATPSSGVRVPVRARADTLARMAVAVGMSAGDLRAVGRDDAASLIPAVTAAAAVDAESSPTLDAIAADPLLTDETREHLTNQYQLLVRVAEASRQRQPPPRDPRVQQILDHPGFTIQEKIEMLRSMDEFVAEKRAERAAADAERGTEAADDAM